MSAETAQRQKFSVPKHQCQDGEILANPVNKAAATVCGMRVSRSTVGALSSLLDAYELCNEDIVANRQGCTCYVH